MADLAPSPPPDQVWRSPPTAGCGPRDSHTPTPTAIPTVRGGPRRAAGARVALVGASGAGKSTLAKLLAGDAPLRTRDPSRSVVPLDWLGAGCRPVVLVTQEVHVFAGPLADDSGWRPPGRRGRRAAGGAVRKSSAPRDTVAAPPDGLGTVVMRAGTR
ncbi:ATP-binding cassette domain-containing protein [Pseudonocardia sp. MCCB 268]|nr:ATP-binding cassette domain-containing protein [Pseudonocardia cytotoxica]